MKTPSSLRFLALPLLILLALASGLRAEGFSLRGYYLTFMRMPAMGLPEWKQAVDCFAEDEVNTLILWMPGGFRSEKFPATWSYNTEHPNVRRDFVRELIDYAHTKNIRVLLGFTPFGYDGINRLPRERPELKAKKDDGTPVDEFGINSWGWSLCPSHPESQRIMREYLQEMVFTFYPNADGLLAESSDYNVCRCAECRAHPYEEEFRLVRWISDEMWKRKPDSLILVYPHYFTGRRVPGLESAAVRQPFDERWGLFFTPHSAHFDADLIRRARTSVYSGPEAALGTPQGIAASAREAKSRGVRGFIPSLEAFSYVADRAERGEPYVAGKRMKPFGFDAKEAGRMPFNQPPLRVQRLAMRTFSQNPDMSFPDFEKQLAAQLFGDAEAREAAADLLELQAIWNHECDWYWSSPLLEPEFLTGRAVRLQWPAEKLQDYDRRLERLRGISARRSQAAHPLERETGRLAGEIVQRWNGRTPSSAVAEAGKVKASK